MRIRALKPGFFKNEQLAELSPWHRLCYEGLWCCADREGRVDDRPKRLKAEIFPYDDLDMNALMWELAHSGFIVRYAVNSRPLVWIPTWAEHQHPRPDEAESQLAPYVPGSERSDGKDVPTQSVRPIDTDPRLRSSEGDTTARMGNGTLDLGSGKWDLGSGNLDMGKAAAPPAVRAQDLLDLWNATTKPPIPRCRELSDDRRKKIRLRLAKRPAMADWQEIFQAIQNTPFYRGENDRQWTADFDWIIKNDSKPTQVLERARTQRGTPTAAYTWECPHQPPCSAPGPCDIKRRIELGKKAS